MKKLLFSIILSALICSASGCSLIEIKSASDSSSSVSDSSDKDKNDSDKKDKDENKDDDSDKEKSDDSKIAENSKTDEKAEKENSDDDNSDNSEKTDNNENDDDIWEDDGESDEDIEAIGKELYKQACTYKFSFLYSGGPFEKNNDITDETDSFAAIEDSRVSSLQDIYDYYCEVFYDSSDIENENTFKVIDGVIYGRQASKGSNIFYDSTELELIEADYDEALFIAHSVYANPETQEIEETKDNEFKLFNTENGWRVVDFTLPY